MHSFIESQFPINALSAECFKERKANMGQTLTGLGKWWGRKPLILVRASLLGLLMPSSGNLSRDREIFLKILTMDDDGLWQRCKGNIPATAWRDAAPMDIQEDYFSGRGWKQGITDEEKEEICNQIWQGLDADQRKALDDQRRRPLPRDEFDALSYAERTFHCERPENIDGPSPEAWAEINAHLGTSATTLPELFEQLADARFGERAKVGDCFCGGGSIPFEAARMGCDAYASDLNPLACLLTWGALNIVGGGPEKVAEVQAEQQRAYQEVERQIEEWGIERSKEGWRAEYYLYCAEIVMPDGWRVPIAPSWVIGKKSRTVALLIPDRKNKRFDFRIKMDATDEEMEAAASGTIKSGIVTNPATGSSIKLSVMRGDRKEIVGRDEKGKVVKETRNNLRQWDADDWKPRIDDFCQDRLYCIRWRNKKGKAIYREPQEFDLDNEYKVEELLAQRFTKWQKEGHIPSMRIEPGFNTSQPMRERGWTHWHQLFQPRSLLWLGLANKHSKLLSVHAFLKSTQYNSKLSNWNSAGALELVDRVFSNQALNTLWNYGARTCTSNTNCFDIRLAKSFDLPKSHVYVNDARTVAHSQHFWITDPPYADAVNYDELSEFFLCWVEKKLPKLFPDWYADSKRALAVKGSEGVTFEDTLVEIYDNLRRHTHPGGMQVIMFTHSSNAVWLSLTRVIRRAGLQVLAVWAVRTETENASKGEGNYVRATYLVVLKDRQSHAPKPKFQVRSEVLREVERLLGDMDSINQIGELNFKFGDLLLSAPTAVLKVLTGYEEIRGLNPLERDAFEAEMLLEAEKFRDERLYPDGFDGSTWEKLQRGERFYLMGLLQESKGDLSQELYQLSSKAYGITDYDDLLASKKANEARLMTPIEMRGRTALFRILGEGSLTGALLGAVWEAERKDSIQDAHRHLRDELGTLTPETAATLRTICRFLAKLKTLPHWERSIDWLKEIDPGIGRL